MIAVVLLFLSPIVCEQFPSQLLRSEPFVAKNGIFSDPKVKSVQYLEDGPLGWSL